MSEDEIVLHDDLVLGNRYLGDEDHIVSLAAVRSVTRFESMNRRRSPYVLRIRYAWGQSTNVDIGYEVEGRRDEMFERIKECLLVEAGRGPVSDGDV